MKDFNDTKIYQVLYINFKYVGVDARILINPSKAVSKGFNVGDNNITTSSEINKDDLYRKIQTYSEQHEIEPIDAKVDRIQILMNKVQIKVRLSHE